ncbi:MAG: cupin domain-containing protein [Bacteroidales bacterium]
MKRKLLSNLAIIAILSLSLSSCSKEEVKDALSDDMKTEAVVFKDYGPEPLVIDIEDYTISNENFRTTIWTGSTIQMTLMSIPVGGDIGLEQHIGIDQFLRIEEGKGKVYMGDTKENLDFVKVVGDDMVVLVPAGKWHNIVNTGDKPLKIYSIYGPVEHPHGTVHKTQADDPDNN